MDVYFMDKIQIPLWLEETALFCMTSSYEEAKLFEDFQYEDRRERHSIFIELDYDASVSHMHVLFNHIKFSDTSVIFVNCLTNIVDLNIIANYIQAISPNSVFLTDAINLHNYID